MTILYPVLTLSVEPMQEDLQICGTEYKAKKTPYKTLPGKCGFKPFAYTASTRCLPA